MPTWPLFRSKDWFSCGKLDRQMYCGKLISSNMEDRNRSSSNAPIDKLWTILPMFTTLKGQGTLNNQAEFFS